MIRLRARILANGPKVKHMPGRIEFVERYTLAMALDDPRRLYLFGDNLKKRGMAGQACIRRAPNSVGIPTKWFPSMDVMAFYRDKDLPNVCTYINAGFAKAAVHLYQGHDIVLPVDGLGTGRAELPERAPLIHKYVLDWVEVLKRIGA